MFGCPQQSLYHNFHERVCHVQHFIFIFIIVQFIVTVAFIIISVAILFCCRDCREIEVRDYNAVENNSPLLAGTDDDKAAADGGRGPRYPGRR